MTDITRETVEARAASLLSDYAADGAAVDADMLLALVNDRDRLAGELAEARKWAKDAIFFDSEYVKAVDQRANEIAAENAILTARIAAVRAALNLHEAKLNHVETVARIRKLVMP